MANQIAAFPGAEGYGAGTVGGRGGAVLHVNSLADSGIGTLRWALEQFSGPRTIVFDVGGTITLKSQILVSNGFVTIAGQTAPGDGIVIEGSRIRVAADEVIIRGLHFRPGDGAVGTAPVDRDGLMVGSKDFDVDNVIIDHNSFSWGIDENVSINGRVHHLTFSNNIVAEGLSKSIHPKGEHSKGLLISNWDGTRGDELTHVSILKNLFSDNMQRNPEVRAGQHVEIINNYIFNYGIGHIAIAVGNGTDGTLVTKVDVIGNVMTPDDSTLGRKAPVMLGKMADGSVVSISDNIYSHLGVDAAGNQLQSLLYWHQFGTAYAAVSSVRQSASNVAILDSSNVAAFVLANAGAVTGAGRDSVDRRIVEEVLAKNGYAVNSVASVSPAGDGKVVIGARDSDSDGMPDWFEDRFGFDKRIADSAGDGDKDGYSNLEEYINGLITGFDLPGARSLQTLVASGGAPTITGQALVSPLRVIGFTGGTGDKVDLTAVIQKFDPATRKLSEFVELVHAAGVTYLSVDPDGPGGTAIKQLVAAFEGARLSLDDFKVDFAKLGTTPAPPAPGGDPVYVPPATTVDPRNYIYGTSGNDNFTVRSQLDTVVERPNSGNDQVVSFVDYKLPDHVEGLSLKGAALSGVGNDLANRMTGNELANKLQGLAGNDRLVGLAGGDRLEGGEGDDALEGGAGNDMLVGGPGIDWFAGGEGGDVFSFARGDALFDGKGGIDRITDFAFGDVLRIEGRSIDVSEAAVVRVTNTSFASVLRAANGAMAGQGTDSVLVQSSKDSWLFWDTDGDRSDVEEGVMLAGTGYATSSSAIASLSFDHPFY